MAESEEEKVQGRIHGEQNEPDTPDNMLERLIYMILTDLGIWVAKAARYQTAASNVKPWPWTELD